MEVSNKPISKVEVKGLEARLYDFLLIAGTFGLYHYLIKKVIKDMNIQPNDRILDLGAGTGKNSCLMLRYLSNKGEIIGLDIGEIMIKKFNKKCKNYQNVNVINRRIEKPLNFNNEFDKVFISFVLHGFQQNDRLNIIKNAYQALKPGGKFFIFDWSKFDINKTGPFLKFFMKKIECPLALEFIELNLGNILLEAGFKDVQENYYAGSKIRFLSAVK